MKTTTTVDKSKNMQREISCNKCNHITNHLICSSVTQQWGNDDIQGVDTYEIVRCLGCDTAAFCKISSNSEDLIYDADGNFDNPETIDIYPSRFKGRKPLEDLHLLPVKVRTIYTETHSAMCTNLKVLTGVGIRALIESVCSEEGADGRSLAERINELVSKDILTKKNADILHQTRILGNRAAHEVEAPSEEELDVAFAIAEHLLETVYIIPKKAERLNIRKCAQQ